jgi:hypothetical protein
VKLEAMKEKKINVKEKISLELNRYGIMYMHLTTRKMISKPFQHCRGRQC